jgi:hypothetical protein
MTFQGIVVLDLIGLVLLFWVLNLIRRDRLYVGYGVVLVGTILGVIVLVSVPPILNFVTRLVGAVFPVSALTLLALGFVVLMLVYVLTQLTILSNRLAVLIQELAIQGARETAERSWRSEKALNMLPGNLHSRRPSNASSGGKQKTLSKLR